MAHLLGHYVAIEKALLAEYRRLGLIEAGQVRAIAGRLDLIDRAALRADPRHNVSDIAFAIERFVTDGLAEPVPAWHVDRSRNDLQACAQQMYVRGEVLDVAEAMLRFGGTAAALAARTADLPMPGYTHLQAAQVITPGFYLAALCGEVLRTLRRLRLSYGEVDACPLGAGAMAGQELAWDRERLAALLGFGRSQPHALTAVASRGYALSVAADLAGFGVTMSRFCTDLMAWGSSEYGFIDLPDSLSGISSAMPQKKNFPILERIRGRTAHLTTFHLDLATGQRSTPYANMVEVSKEAGAHLRTLFETVRSVLTLFTAVLEHLRFDAAAMRAACERDYLGGFTLANLLTLRVGLPWRSAQVTAGRYVVLASGQGLPPDKPDGRLLARLVDEQHAEQHDELDPRRAEGLLSEAFGVDNALAAKRSAGSTNPAAVAELLAAVDAELTEQGQWWRERRDALRRAGDELQRTLATRG
ncbi:MAG TPA: lyase family protein [Pseudonocardiaceae bacterium]|nr:lyase family protein [Pseudonocardiaceae bacterium]